jgi:hypothetical protein
MTRISLLLLITIIAVSGCAWNSRQHGGYDGMRSAQWGSGVPFIGLRFDRERYRTDCAYREAFDQGLEGSRAVTWPFTDASDQVRQLLRLDELKAQAGPCAPTEVAR